MPNGSKVVQLFKYCAYVVAQLFIFAIVAIVLMSLGVFYRWTKTTEGGLFLSRASGYWLAAVMGGLLLFVFAMPAVEWWRGMRRRRHEAVTEKSTNNRDHQ